LNGARWQLILQQILQWIQQGFGQWSAQPITSNNAKQHYLDHGSAVGTDQGESGAAQ